MERKVLFELLNGKKPNVDNLVLYGSLCYVRVPDERGIDKFSRKGIQGIVLVMMI